ncbi:MAG: hypothetical protein AAF830_09320 [Pseudomonadota bacterium]
MHRLLLMTLVAAGIGACTDTGPISGRDADASEAELAPAAPAGPPDIIVILADDLGLRTSPPTAERSLHRTSTSLARKA